ncbi:MAG: hypothetical protein KIT80_05110 [Chitinophagaceae bacterium]|nr:hypothetical protein [Chitinophagaceae bacterium]MCW5926273.1 hypothetical protein [Chitinophagaceae bacterium]
MINKFLIGIFIISLGFSLPASSQTTDTLKVPMEEPGQVDTVFKPLHQEDSTLRIRNLNPYITLHVDSTLEYELEINKDQSNYFWYLMNAPVGLRVNRNTGLLSFKADKGFFLSGRLKYDKEYKVNLGIQNLDNPHDKLDTSFILLFYNTEIIPSKVKPAVNNILYVDEGDSISFKVQCEDGSFPIEKITMTSNYPLKTIGVVTHCGDDFVWSPPFGFVKSTDAGKEKKVVVNFIGVTKFNVRDTAVVNIIVKENINYPQKVLEFNEVKRSISKYISQLKATFMHLDKQVKRTKNTRTSLELSSAATALGGTVFSSLPTDGQKTAGKILPSAGVAMVPVKESVAPTKTAEQRQNSATLIRNSIKRLEYSLQNNALVGERDPEIIIKTQKMRDSIKEIQTQMIEVPLVDIEDSEADLDKYFNNPKVNKKYRMKK